MTDPNFAFTLEATSGMARLGRVETSRGGFDTPMFMPVGTLGTVKSLTPQDLEDVGAEIILGNTYHLYLRPGMGVMEQFGGLHRFMDWSGPILTDSGGFQFYSLSDLAKFDDDGVDFRSHIDGSKHRFTPERVVEIQATIGSTIMMQLDQCPALPATPKTLEQAVKRSTDWALRSLAVADRAPGALFAIGQGGTDVSLRIAHIEELSAHAFDGIALGGLAVGEAPEDMYDTLEAVTPSMPADRPRYLMGVGRPEDLVEAIGRGIDMFDCVMPTRNARKGSVFTRTGKLNLRNAGHRHDEAPLDPSCGCLACRRFSRAYLHHLFRNKELLGPRLATLHNLTYYLDLVRDARAAIRRGEYDTFRRSCHAGWTGGSHG